MTMSTGLVAMGVRLGFVKLGVNENVLQVYTEEIVCKTAVRIVTCQRPVIKRLVLVIAVVQRDGNLLCVYKNVRAQVMEEIAATCAVIVTKEFRVTRKMESVRRGVPQAMKESTVTKHALIRTMDRIATLPAALLASTKHVMLKVESVLS